MRWGRWGLQGQGEGKVLNGFVCIAVIYKEMSSCHGNHLLVLERVRLYVVYTKSTIKNTQNEKKKV